MNAKIIIKCLQNGTYKSGFFIYGQVGDRITHCNLYELLGNFENRDDAISVANTGALICKENPPRPGGG